MTTQAGNAWRVLLLLFLVNLLNFFDRTLPSVVAEPMRKAWGLSDLQLGLAGSAFVVIYAIAGVPLGRMADSGSRKKVLGWGLIAWSGLTAATGAAWSYGSFLLIRMGVGVGEASCAPAATSLIGDLFPSHKRARAMGVFMLGLPFGLLAAFFIAGPMVKAFGDWRVPFYFAALPGVLLAVLVFFIREPGRGAAESTPIAAAAVARPIRTLLAIPTLRWVILSGLTVNFAVYAGNGFLVALLQRYFHLPIDQASIITGLIVGLTGLAGLTLGGVVADKLHQRSERGRLLFGAVSLAIAAPLTWCALQVGSDGISAFAWLFGLGWLSYYSYYTCVYPAVHDVVQPRLRATAFSLYFAGMYLLGGAMGPLVVGAISDHFAHAAMQAAGGSDLNLFKAQGLHDALFLIPWMFLLTALFVFLAARSFPADAAKMKREITVGL